MKIKFLSLSIFAGCAIALLAFAIHFYCLLPDQIAFHFNGRGNPNGWSTKDSFLLVMLSIGFGVPTLVTAIMYSIRFIPAKMLNVPNPEFWKLPRNHKKLCSFLLTSSYWFGSGFMVWQILFSKCIVTANLLSPPKLNNLEVLISTGGLLVFTTGWMIALLLPLLKKNTVEQGAAANP